MIKIDMCVIGSNARPDIDLMRKIEGLKIRKQANKPFFDVCGTIKAEDNTKFLDLISDILMDCRNEAKIYDKDLEAEIVAYTNKQLMEQENT